MDPVHTIVVTTGGASFDPVAVAAVTGADRIVAAVQGA